MVVVSLEKKLLATAHCVFKQRRNRRNLVSHRKAHITFNVINF